MTYRSLRILLFAAGAAVSLSAAATACLSLMFPLADASRDAPHISVSQSSQVPKEAGNGQKRLGVDEFKYVWAKALQRPVVDPPAPKPAKAAPAVAPPQQPVVAFGGTLMGTLVDSDPEKTRAWLLFGQQGQRLVAPGEVLNDLPGQPQIVSITDKRVLVKIGNRETRLEILNDAPAFISTVSSE